MTAELLLTLPILMILLAGMMGVSQLLLARQALAAASHEGARVGAAGGDAGTVQLAVQRTLAASGPLVQAKVNVQFVQVDGGPNGPIQLVVVTTSAPVGLALLGSPSSPVSALANQNVAATSIMRVN
ncbi:MAG TPA: TadE/TadG family type IV pilus assembly protein [Gemmataceae bacterium]|nr:TadE/TadG family type IV pilus assembly protein [Gemmataceae bacterium]